MRPSPEEVVELLELHMGGPFKWGTEDCFISSTSVFSDLFGVDLGADLRGTYSTEAEAEQVLRAYGNDMLVLMMTLSVVHGLERGFSRLPPVGAIGLSPREKSIGLDGRCTCIHIGEGLWAAKARRGYSFSVKAEVFWHV